jgi:hypothetical protein
MSDNLMVCHKSERYVKILMIIESSDSDVSKLDFPYFPTMFTDNQSVRHDSSNPINVMDMLEVEDDF